MIDREDDIQSVVRCVLALQVLSCESEGVMGYHLNGDVSTWGELQYGAPGEPILADFDAAIDAAYRLRGPS